LIANRSKLQKLLADALVCHGAGRLMDAERLYRQVLAQDSKNADGLHLLGVVAYQTGRYAVAIDLILKAIGIRGEVALFYTNLGNALHKSGRSEDAVAAYFRSLSLDAESVAAYGNLAVALTELGQPAAAAKVCLHALCLGPDYLDGHCNLGNASHKAALPNQAAVSFRRALRIDHSCVRALCNLSAAFKDLDRFLDAEGYAKRAVVLQTDDAESLSNIATSLSARGQLGLAMRLHDRALALDPGRPLLRANAAHTLFCLGRLRDGWQAWESRVIPDRFSALPRWDGCPAPDKTILVWKEQGVADQLLSLSMVADAVRVVGSLVVECDPRMVDLVARSFPEVTVLPHMLPPHPLCEAADAHLPMFSLGAYCRNELTDFPRHDGYLRPEPKKVAYWKSWLNTLGPGVKVGLSWRSMSGQLADFLPSLERLQPVLSLPGTIFVNLQYGAAEEEIEAFWRRNGIRIHIPSGLDVTDDFDGLAGLIGALDMVTGTSTTASILAGAVGRPTLMYMYYPVYNENRMLGQDYMPWHPSARIVTYGYGEDLDLLVKRYVERLSGFIAQLQASD